ncbi:MAG: DUF4215 domain-containing protein [Deltaproteobacteria bacterium]|nr:DUF4215 domain-containing protein [Deltaproteobacteria bacterium]
MHRSPACWFGALAASLLAAASLGCEEETAPPVDPCRGVTCSFWGVCITDGVSAYCSCEPGYHPVGRTCVPNNPDNPCLGVDCNDAGDCRVQDGLPICDCDPHYQRDDSGMLCLPLPDSDADAGTDDGADADADDADAEADGEDAGPECGNGTVEGTEQCDDGNDVPADGCEVDCTWTCEATADCDDDEPCNGTETCGTDHVCTAGTPEADGTDCTTSDGDPGVCRSELCALISCGNGLLDPGEECDDANADNTDACLANCTDASCGDGFVHAGSEECDDADSVSGDGCEATCLFSCHNAAECADSDPCTADTCAPVADGQACDNTISPGTPCDDGLACTSGDACDAAGACTSGAIAADACLIGGSCHADGEDDPAAFCQECAPGTSRTTWTNKSEGTVCDDGLYCTLSDACNAAGACVGTGTPCGGCETCDEDTDDCVSAGRRFTPGVTRVVTGAREWFWDVYRSPAGTLFTVSNNTFWVGEIHVARSTDNGLTWTDTNLGNAYGNHTYVGRIFPIDANTIGVTGGQGTNSPYDSHLQYSTNDGVSYNGTWINLSNSGDLWGNKAMGVVLRMPDSNYLGLFTHVLPYTRIGTSLTSWSSTPRESIGTEQICHQSALVVGSSVYMAMFPCTTGEPYGFRFYESTDNGNDFTLRASVTTSVPHYQGSGELWHDPASGILYLCTGAASAGTNQTVYTYCSTDGGRTWGGETPYLTGLSLPDYSAAACYMDSTGIYVSYKDATSGEARIVLPGAGVTWSSADPMTTARQDHTATLLDDGTVLVVGGYDGGTFLTSAERYDPATNRWTPAGNMTRGRAMHVAALLNSGSVLIAGGSSPYPTFIASAELHDPLAGSWSGTDSMAEDRGYSPAIFLHDGRLFVMGGFTYIGGAYVVGSRATTELYDPTAASWSFGTPMLQDRRTHVAVTLADGRILVAGGDYGNMSDHGVRRTAEIHDPVAESWTATGSMAFKRAYFGGVRLPDGRVLVAGGVYLDAPGGPFYYPPETEIFDPAAGTWTTVAPMSVGRSGPTLTLLPDGRAVVIGGSDGSTTHDTAEVYDPVTDSWLPAGVMSTPRGRHTATTLPDGRILVVGGSNGAAPVASVDILTPP